MEAWIILFAIVTTLVVCIQLIALGGLFIVTRRVLSKAKEAEDKLRLNGVDPYEAAVRSYRLLERAEAATNQAIDATASAKELLAEVRAQIARVDSSVSSFFGRA
ncbi:MAG TPA: hypothetical protein VFZ08_14890, partial [Terriglobia bacterium]|nr:hypothetical protein [Terriglobia bacterium]